mgnify:CR=1 FL=1
MQQPRDRRHRLGGARLTERIDSVLLHPALGLMTFLGVMLVVFQALFAWADPAIRLIEAGFGWIGDSLAAALPAGILTDLLVQGVVGGVGNVLVFGARDYAMRVSRSAVSAAVSPRQPGW